MSAEGSMAGHHIKVVFLSVQCQGGCIAPVAAFVPAVSTQGRLQQIKASRAEWRDVKSSIWVFSSGSVFFFFFFSIQNLEIFLNH